MKITVCVKYCAGEINPFDASALECALQIPDSEVTVLSMSPPSCKEPLLSLTRLPIHEVVMLCDNAFAGSDTLATSYILASYLKKNMPDMIICGRQSIDGDTAQVGPCLATMLGMSLVTNVMEYGDGICKTRLGDISYTTPALLTVERVYNLRFFSIRSRVRPDALRLISADELGVDRAKCGLGGSPTVVMKCFENTAGRRRVKWIDKNDLLPLLDELKKKERKKANDQESGSSEKLPTVTVIGADMEAVGEKIAHSVKVIEDTDTSVIAEKVAGDEVVLWKADLWGRNNAPIVQAKLNTGLCADCTQLEVSEGEFYMYRPARSGSITAKIKCTAKPKMATVRVESESSGIMLAIGKGAVSYKDKIEGFAREIGAELAASRAVVDMGKAPYEQQVGLTGKTVAPKIYLAVGISGAVHHTCAIEGVDTIIAVNPDKDARIFDYADYGILANAEDLF